MATTEKQLYKSTNARLKSDNFVQITNDKNKVNHIIMIPRFSIVAILLLFVNVFCFGQGITPRFTQPDKSPMDMAYYPVDYPKLKARPTPVTEPLIVRVIYSRPQKMGRKVFGELVEDGKIWRLGANEATEIEFYREVKIGNKRIKKGRYSMYALENKSQWTIIFNSELDSWGAFNYSAAKDVLRVNCTVQKITEPLESFSMQFEKLSGQSCQLYIAWDDVMVALPISW